MCHFPPQQKKKKNKYVCVYVYIYIYIYIYVCMYNRLPKAGRRGGGGSEHSDVSIVDRVKYTQLHHIILYYIMSYYIVLYHIGIV